MPRATLRDVVIILPGIMGSVLARHGDEVWDISGRAFLRAAATLGDSLWSLALENDDHELDDLDGVTATRLMAGAHLVPGFVGIDGYAPLQNLVAQRFACMPGTLGDDGLPAYGNVFDFPYDWRRDCRAASRRLDAFATRALDRWRAYTGNPGARLILLAHSMGGLVSRHFLEARGGWDRCRALVTFGTPHRGSPQALDRLVNGLQAGLLVTRVELTAMSTLLRSFTSVYQLLPRYRCLLVDGSWRYPHEAGLSIPHLDEVRAAEAFAFHQAIEAGVASRPRDAYDLISIVGTDQHTIEGARWDGAALHALTTTPPWIDASLGEGDGTVPRVSAIPIEMSNALRGLQFVAGRHGSLQAMGRVLDEVEQLVRQSQSSGLADIRGVGEREEVEAPGLAVSVPDMVTAGEPLALSLAVRRVSGSVTARVTAEPLDVAGTSPAAHTVTVALAGDVPTSIVIGPLAAGLWRISADVTSGASVPAVSDLVEALGRS